MYNSIIAYTLIQDGVKTENTHCGNYGRGGSFYRVVFPVTVDGKQSEHSYVKTGENAFKIIVKGDTSYSIAVKQGERGQATLKTSGVEFPFEVTAYKCSVTADDNGMEIYADYDIVSFGQKIKNELKLTVFKKGEIKC